MICSSDMWRFRNTPIASQWGESVYFRLNIGIEHGLCIIPIEVWVIDIRIVKQRREWCEVGHFIGVLGLQVQVRVV